MIPFRHRSDGEPPTRSSRRLGAGAAAIVGRGAMPLAAGVLLLVVSCASVRRDTWERHYLSREGFGSMTVEINVVSNGGAGQAIVLDRDALAKFEGESVTRGLVRISHPAGLGKASADAASWLDGALRDTQRELGFDLPTRFHLILVPVEGEMGSLKARYAVVPEEFVAPAPVWPEQRTAEAVLSGPLGQSVLIFCHEMFELMLVVPWARPTALPDGRGPLGLRSKNHTRWFRDGFATYAAMVTMENLRRRSGNRWPVGREFGDLLFDRPFSSLSEVGGDLFDWHQFSAGRHDEANYNASFGLFLLIEERFGRSAIRGIVREMGSLEYPDGAAIESACRRVLGEEVRALVAGYSFPPAAVEVSHAMRELEGAVAVRVAGHEVATPFDFERAFERARADGRFVEVGLTSREGAAAVQVPAAP